MSQKRQFEAHDIGAAFSLLTRLPVPVDHARAGARGAASVWAWPIVGAILGGICGAVAVGLIYLGVPTGVAAAAAIGIMAIMTGALHEDGLTDSADGLGGGRNRAHALDIMKDSNIGAFGAVALCAVVIARWSGIAALPPETMIAVLSVAGAGSRTVMALAMRMPNARDGGLSASVGQPGWSQIGVAVVISVGVAGVMFGWAGIGLLVGGLLAVPVLIYARAKIGGQTGDILGASQMIAELGIIVMATAVLIP